MRKTSMAAIVAALTIGGCGSMPAFMGGTSDSGPKAVARIEPTTAGKASGTVSFLQQPNGVLVIANVTGLTPGMEHGFHVHEVADCSGDGTKAGGHFNPDANPHGNPGQKVRHAGAMFNLKADSNGTASFTQLVDTVTLNEGKYSIVGKPLIVHARPDDYASQPLGNAGGRIGCGIIEQR